VVKHVDRAWYVLAARGLVVKQVDAIELRVVVGAVLAVDAVLVAQHLLKLGAHLATALARLHVRNLARRRGLEAGSARGLTNARASWLFCRGSS
jgi:hypothetical protein